MASHVEPPSLLFFKKKNSILVGVVIFLPLLSGRSPLPSQLHSLLVGKTPPLSSSFFAPQHLSHCWGVPSLVVSAVSPLLVGSGPRPLPLPHLFMLGGLHFPFLIPSFWLGGLSLLVGWGSPSPLPPQPSPFVVEGCPLSLAPPPSLVGWSPSLLLIGWSPSSILAWAVSPPLLVCGPSPSCWLEGLSLAPSWLGGLPPLWLEDGLHFLLGCPPLPFLVERTPPLSSSFFAPPPLLWSLPGCLGRLPSLGGVGWGGVGWGGVGWGVCVRMVHPPLPLSLGGLHLPFLIPSFWLGGLSPLVGWGSPSLPACLGRSWLAPIFGWAVFPSHSWLGRLPPPCLKEKKKEKKHRK